MIVPMLRNIKSVLSISVALVGNARSCSSLLMSSVSENVANKQFLSAHLLVPQFVGKRPELHDLRTILLALKWINLRENKHKAKIFVVNSGTQLGTKPYGESILAHSYLTSVKHFERVVVLSSVGVHVNLAGVPKCSVYIKNTPPPEYVQRSQPLLVCRLWWLDSGIYLDMSHGTDIASMQGSAASNGTAMGYAVETIAIMLYINILFFARLNSQQHVYRNDADINFTAVSQPDVMGHRHNKKRNRYH
uniref:Uncharacterized protein n=1 Tax=Glossina pallidipes TaxID=7398 RepID=A0A1B0A820_GLOPL